MSCELKLFLPQLSASEGEAANRLDRETTLLVSHELNVVTVVESDVKL